MNELSVFSSPLQGEQHLAGQYLERAFRQTAGNNLLITVDLATEPDGDAVLLISAYYNARLVLLETARVTCHVLRTFRGVPPLMMIETWREFRQRAARATPAWFAFALSPEAEAIEPPPHASRTLRLPGDHGRPLPTHIKRLYQREFFN